MKIIYFVAFFLITAFSKVTALARDTILLLTKDQITEQQFIRLIEMDGWIFKPGNNTRSATDIYLNEVKQNKVENHDVQKTAHQQARLLDGYPRPLNLHTRKDKFLSLYLVDHHPNFLTRYKSQQRPENLRIGLAGPEFVK
ncbi:MAG TPA: hypothetical protein ENN08_02880 [Bacteroidales bacterium]|nr:hypothetical protein [Bacteroidales bacterium]